MPTLSSVRSEKDLLPALQRQVGGYIEILSPASEAASEYTLYVNEEGMLQNLPKNTLGWEIAKALDFHCGYSDAPYLFGNVVILGKDERPLTKEQQNHIQDLCKKRLGL